MDFAVGFVIGAGVMYFFCWCSLDKKLLKSRYAGCKVIEEMVMKRASEHGYDTKRIWKDLLQ